MQFTKDQVEFANSMRPNTLVDHLDISFGLSQQGQLTASMPVDHRTHQSMGLLHGGATAALAETLGSMGSALLLDLERWAIVGMEVSANHLRGVREGRVTATGELVHQGRTTHVWDIRVRNEATELCAICRMTNLIIEKRK
ncbi:MAG: hotdog fold thioesterase [Flavobacteriales bacterium]|jgi:1,4-dihydroxy-2-naphthoyl-CoA hydrolase|nr:hotdog fold thioesterase [Flavobacteriales bacterium]MBK6551434.1 hotdog fold thioesterase [Flavobacteriales bacterium]MBK6882833.1 hotdog fold thioesterase [Flavobacteriales bacterium]MBK7114174.1 hotdog fold thioesterase [Flavobacteriales bacterium]MBK7483773.1 hotdog fold thioesterase [Flavobacteriales bacterium]